MAASTMIQDILAQLFEERKLLQEAIANLEQLATGRKRGRGRPPNRPTSWMRNDQNGQAVSVGAD